MGREVEHTMSFRIVFPVIYNLLEVVLVWMRSIEDGDNDDTCRARRYRRGSRPRCEEMRQEEENRQDGKGYDCDSLELSPALQ